MNVKKITALLTAASMMMSLVAVFADDQKSETFDSYDTSIQEGIYRLYDNYTLLGEETTIPDDAQKTETDKYTVAKEKLNAFGIVLGGLDSGEVMSRAAFLTMVMRSVGHGDGMTDTQYFYDVAKDHMYASYINAAYEMKVISGSDGFFKPDDAITYHEALSILVRVMGLGLMAERSGGYPQGVVKAARDAELLDEVEVSDYTLSIKAGDAYLMMVNALTSTSYMRFDTIDADGAVYTNRDETTMLEEYFGIIEAEDIVWAVGLSNLLSDDSVGKNKVQIGETVYNGAYDDYISMLGYQAEYYYTKEDKDLVYASVSTPEEDVLRLMGTDDLEFSNQTYTYYNTNGKKKSVSIADGAAVLYNGAIATGDIPHLYTPQNGTVTLIDPNGSGKYSVVLIEEYKDIIVGAIDIANSVVYDKYDGDISIKFEENNDNVSVRIVGSEGKPTYPAFLSEDDVLSVKISGNQKVIEGVVSSGNIKGGIEKIRTDKDTTVTVSGVDYVLTKECVTRFEKYVQLGKTVTLYPNVLGKIAAIREEDGGDLKYGYVIAYQKTDGIFDKTVAVKLIGQDGIITSYDLAKKCKIDGIVRDTWEKQMQALNNGLDVHKVIKYKTDEDVLTQIDTTYFETSAEPEEGSVSAFSAGNNFQSKLHYKANGNVGNAFFWNKNTTFFVYCPSASDEKSMYRVLPTAGAGIGNDEKYICAGYTDEHSYLADAVVFRLDSVAGTVSSDTWRVVTEVSEGLDAEGGSLIYIESSDGSGKETVTMDKTEYQDNGLALMPGDVIRYDAIEGEVLNGALKCVYNYSTNQVTETLSDGSQMGNDHDANDVYSLRLGYVYDKVGEYFLLAPELNRSALSGFSIANGLVVEATSNTPITLVRKVKDGVEVTGASGKDLKSYQGTKDSCSKVLVRYVYMMHRQIVIYDETV